MEDVLAGIRVVEVAAWTFVPISGAVLAEWGADVIKIEHPASGDPQRGLVSSGLVPGDSGVNFMFEVPNRGKRSVGLDLSTDGGRELLYRLVETADVFVTNHLPDVRDAARHRRRAHPRRATRTSSTCAARAPDSAARERHRGGFDGASYWARGGLAMTFKEPKAEWPVDQRPAFGDVLGGLTIAGGIAAALVRRERTGTPSVVDVSLLGMGLWSLAPEVTSAKLYEGIEHAGLRSRLDAEPARRHLPDEGRPLHHRSCCCSPIGSGPTSCAHLERPDLLDDPRFKDARGAVRAPRRVHRGAAGRLPHPRRTTDWCERLQNAARECGHRCRRRSRCTTIRRSSRTATSSRSPRPSGAEFVAAREPGAVRRDAAIGARRARARRAHRRGPVGARPHLRRDHRAQGHGSSAVSDFDAIDFFRDDALIADPYPYFEDLRARCPVQREPHHDVVMVTGYEEALAVYHDTATFSSCNSVSGPFPGFPVPLGGRRRRARSSKRTGTSCRCSDQLPTLDPPVHTAHRALLMRLLTPKRLKENEEFMWRLADRQIDEFVANGRCEFIREFAGAVHHAGDRRPPRCSRGGPRGVPRRSSAAAHRRAVGSTDQAMAHNPLEFLYQRFSGVRRGPSARTARRRADQPRDGDVPRRLDARGHRRRAPSRRTSSRPGQETTVRLLGTAFMLLAERPDLQQLLRDDRRPDPQLHRGGAAVREPGQGRLPPVAGADDRRRRRPPGRAPRSWCSTAPRTETRATSTQPGRVPSSIARTHGSTSRSGTAPTSALAHRSPGPRARVSIERLLDHMADIRISEAEHGPADARRYEYVPTYILRGLRRAPPRVHADRLNRRWDTRARRSNGYVMR